MRVGDTPKPKEHKAVAWWCSVPYHPAWQSLGLQRLLCSVINDVTFKSLLGQAFSDASYSVPGIRIAWSLPMRPAVAKLRALSLWMEDGEVGGFAAAVHESL